MGMASYGLCGRHTSCLSSIHKNRVRNYPKKKDANELNRINTASRESLDQFYRIDLEIVIGFLSGTILSVLCI